MRQHRWLELIKDYDCEIKYTPGKGNVVADALSRKGGEILATIKSYKLVINSELFDGIRRAQEEVLNDAKLMKTERIVGQQKELVVNSHGVKTRYGRMWIPRHGGLREKVLDEAHKSRYSIHPGTTKMYQDLKKDYWWPAMKHEVTVYVSKCLTCLQVKAEHKKPGGLLQPLVIPEWNGNGRTS